jgi:hypothetical protein
MSPRTIIFDAIAERLRTIEYYPNILVPGHSMSVSVDEMFVADIVLRDDAIMVSSDWHPIRRLSYDDQSLIDKVINIVEDYASDADDRREEEAAECDGGED